VIACLALAVALSGTSYAAVVKLLPKNSVGSAQVINGSLKKGDLAKKTISALKGNRGAQGAPGLQGIQGAQGIQGPPGPFPDGNLPAGKTIRGNYSLYGHAAGTGEWTYGSISFGFRLAAVPALHYIKVGNTPPPECPGAVSAPEAAPGHLCVYEGSSSGNTSANRNVTNLLGAGGRVGMTVYTTPAGAGNYSTVGTWAVTG
jgi:hypothetical protein